MARKHVFKQADVARALKAAAAAGLKVTRFEVDPASGRIIVISGEAMAVEMTPLEQWRAPWSELTTQAYFAPTSIAEMAPRKPIGTIVRQAHALRVSPAHASSY